LGVSLNPVRHSFRTVAALDENGFRVCAIGPREGLIGRIPVLTGFPELGKIHTVNLYLSPERQESYIDYLLKLHPTRIIFNKKTFNSILWDKASTLGIRVEEGCSLVLLAKGTYWGD
jgi:predicted CoA-binding protein